MRIGRRQTSTRQTADGGARQPPVFLQPTDRVTREFDGVGALANPVAAEGEA